MGFENESISEIAKAERPKITREEQELALKDVNINDADVLEKLALICGSKPENFLQVELENLRKYAKEGGHQPLEWSPASTNEKFFIEDDGSFTLGR